MTSISPVPTELSANEAACVTGVPLKQVHRIIDSGLLHPATGGARACHAVRCDALVGLKLAHDAKDLLTVEGCRRLASFLREHPDARTARERNISVDLRAIKGQIRRGFSRLAKARDAVESDNSVLSGTPCFKGTRIPVHDVADMLTNGDSVGAIHDAFPQLSKSQIELATFYAQAYPRRALPCREPNWRTREPLMTIQTTLEDLRTLR